MTRAAIWARVSTDDQDSGNQLAELRAWAERRGFTVVTEYVLNGTSAWNGKQRDALSAALADARVGKWDVLLCWSLDRLSREGVEVTLGWLRRFHEAGAPVWSLRESWTETADPHMAELLASIYAWMARQESQRRSERVKAGIARRKAADPSFKPGRQAGARDRTPRRRSGYVARQERERAERGRTS